MGADGVALGTRLLASPEANIHREYKQRIIDAQATDTVYTNIFDKGWPNSHERVLKNSTYQQWLDAGSPLRGARPGEHDIVAQLPCEGPIERYSNYLPAPTMKGDLEAMAHYAGQSVGLINSQMSIKNILADVIDEATQCIQACQKYVL